MKISNAIQTILLAALFSASCMSPVSAQPTDARTSDEAVVVDNDRDEDGFDWGLLGLLGLLGLIPRKRQDVVVHRDDANRTGSNRS